MRIIPETDLRRIFEEISAGTIKESLRRTASRLSINLKISAKPEKDVRNDTLRELCRMMLSGKVFYHECEINKYTKNYQQKIFIETANHYLEIMTRNNGQAPSLDQAAVQEYVNTIADFNDKYTGITEPDKDHPEAGPIKPVKPTDLPPAKPPKR